MKKNIFWALLLALFSFTSCADKDEVEIICHNDLTLDVSTTTLYETYGSDSYQTYLLSGEKPYQIGVFTYIYDEDGICVDSTKTFSKQFSRLSQVFTGLKRGKYTIMTIETLVNTDYNNTSEYWNIIQSEKLSTLAIMRKQDSFVVLWDGVIAICNKELNIESDETVEITPQPIGSLLTILYLNFDKTTKYNLLSFNTKDRADGIKLDPRLTGAELFIGNYNPENTWTLHHAYYKDAMEPQMQATIYMLESTRQTWCFGPTNVNEETNTIDGFAAYPNEYSQYTFDNGKQYYAGFFYKGGNVGHDCEAFLGTESEFLSWYKTLNWDIAKDFVFEEPNTIWGTKVSSVKSYMNAYEQLSDIEINSNGEYELWYYGKDSETAYKYVFTESTQGLKDVSVYFDSKSVTVEMLVDYFKSKSNYGEPTYWESLGVYSFDSKDGKVSVIIYELSDFLVVNFYNPKNYSRAESAHAMSLMAVSGKQVNRPHLSISGRSYFLLRNKDCRKTYLNKNMKK